MRACTIISTRPRTHSRRWLISQVSAAAAAVLFQTSCGAAAQTKAHHEWYAKIIEWTVEHNCELVRMMPVISPEQRDGHEEHTVRVDTIGHFKPCMTEIYIPI